MIPPADDIDRIMAVMTSAFDPAFGEAWNRRQLEDALVMGNCHYGLIGETGEMPTTGKVAAGFFLSRYGFEEEELLLFAIAPEFRRRGLGSRLLERFIDDAVARGASSLFLEMRADNPAGQLYRQHGFLPVGRRANYYRTPTGVRLDAVTFVRECFGRE